MIDEEEEKEARARGPLFVQSEFVSDSFHVMRYTSHTHLIRNTPSL
jgi:hypothetical protein